MSRRTLILTVLGSLAVAVIIALSVGSLRQRRSTAQLVETLLATPRTELLDRVDFRRLEGLPEPVARYLRHVLRDGQRSTGRSMEAVVK